MYGQFRNPEYLYGLECTANIWLWPKEGRILNNNVTAIINFHCDSCGTHKVPLTGEGKELLARPEVRAAYLEGGH